MRAVAGEGEGRRGAGPLRAGRGRSGMGDKGWEGRGVEGGHKYVSDVGTRMMRLEWTSRTD